MADIPLKPEDEMTNDLVGAVENIAQSVKAGSRDFTKSFTGLTTAIKRLQTTLVNAIKAIKIQVVAKPEKVQKPATKDKATSTKEVVKEKETKTEVAPEKKAKIPKIDPNAALDEKVLGYIRKNPEVSGGRIEKDIGSGEGTLSSPELKDSLERLIRQNKILEDSIGGSSIRMYSANPEIKSPEIKSPEIKAPDAAQKKEPKQKTPKAPSQPKVVDPADEAEKQRKRVVREEADNANKRLRDLRLLAAEERKKERDARPEKEDQKKKEKEEKAVRSIGEQGSKKFVGPRLEEEGLANEKAKKDKQQADIAKDKTATDAKKAQEKKDAADAKSIANEKKTQDKKDAANARAIADEIANAANDLIKQQDQAAKELAQANQRTQKELDSMIAGFQGLSALFRGPLVNYGLKMIAKGVGYKQPKEMSKGGDVSYLADGGDASGPMKPKGTDTVPAMLTPNEFVVNEPAARNPENRKILESINSGKGRKKTEYYAAGAIVGAVARTGAGSGGAAAASGGARSAAAGGAAAGGAAAGGTSAASGGGGGGKITDLFKKIDFSEFGKKFKDLSSKFPVVGIASTALGIALNSVVHSVKIASQALAVFGPMVAKANPALMQKLEIVMNDLSGVIGRALIPAVEYLSPLLRKYADYVDYSMKKLTPSINKSAVAFDNVVSPLMDLGAVVYSVIGPVFNALATIVVGVSNVLKPIIEFVTAFSSALVQVIGVLGSPIVSVAMATLSFAFGALTLVIKTTLEIIQTLLGAFVNIVGLIIQGLGKVISYIPLMGDVGESIAKGGEAISKSGENLKQGKPAEQDRIKKGSSVGAAVREVSSTSIAGVGDEVRKNAMMAASGQKTQEDMLGDISTKLDKNSLADAFAEGIKKAGSNKPQATPPVPIQGKQPVKNEKPELGMV